MQSIFLEKPPLGVSPTAGKQFMQCGTVSAIFILLPTTLKTSDGA